MPLRPVLAGLLAFQLTAAPALARAADAEADDYAAALTRAIAAKERALDVNEPTRWEEALRLFQEAAARRYTRECAYEIGVAAERLARQDLAVESYEAAIDLGLVGPPRARAQAFVAAHAPGLARLTVRGAAGTSVRIAGVLRGRLPLQRPLVLFPGEVRLDLTDAARGPFVFMVRLRAGQLDVLDLDRTPHVTGNGPDQPERGRPPAAPPAPAPTPAGVVAPAPAPAVVPLPSQEPKPPDAPEGIPTRGFWLMGVGAAVAIAAVVLLPVSAGQIESDRRALADECMTMLMNDACIAKPGRGPAAQSLSDSIATWKAVQTGAWIGVGVGAAAIAAGAFLRYRDRADAAASRPALVLDQHGGRWVLGLAWRSTF